MALLALYVTKDGQETKKLATAYSSTDQRRTLNTEEKQREYLTEQMNGWVQNGGAEYASAKYTIAYNQDMRYMR